jgi:hypothetical protein
MISPNIKEFDMHNHSGDSQRVELEKTNPFAEIDAMKKVAEALTDLDEAACARVLNWADERYRSIPRAAVKKAIEVQTENPHPETTAPTNEFADLADLYHKTSPKSDPEKALVVGYWLQVQENNTDLDSFRVNQELKGLGYPVGNITAAFTSLMERKPQLVMQTKKAGTSQQARKKYRLTDAGKKAVETLLRGEPIT